MSIALDAATMIHSKQVNAAVMVQDLYISIAQKLADTVRTVGGRAVPDAISQQSSARPGPVAKVLGTPAELAAHVARSTHDWAGMECRFRTAILEALMPLPTPGPAIRSVD